MKVLPQEALQALHDRFARDPRVPDLLARWHADHNGPRPYFLLDENEEHTVWLLGWRPGVDTVDHHTDATPIHGHGDSAALVTCILGEVDNDDYGLVVPRTTGENDGDGSFSTTVARAGAPGVYVPIGGVHEMRCDERDGRGFSATIHVYAPRLTTMTYFERGADGVLRFASDWREEDAA